MKGDKMTTAKSTKLEKLEKIKIFIKELSERGGHALFFEDRKEDKELLTAGFKLLGDKARWYKPEYYNRMTGKKNTRNGVSYWSHLDHTIDYVDGDKTKGVEKITTFINWSDGAWVNAELFSSRQISASFVSMNLVSALGISGSTAGGRGTETRENHSLAIAEIDKQIKQVK